MAKRAIIVIGAMSSGTRMLVHAVESVGFQFLRLEGHLDQPKVDGIDFPEDDPPLIVLHRTLPSGEHWPNFDLLGEQLEGRGYEWQPLVIRRDWHSTIHSQLYRALTPTVEDAEADLRRGTEIAGQLPGVILVSYEEFVHRPAARRWLFVDRLGLSEPTGEFHDANTKHYDPDWPPPGARRGLLP